MPKSTSETTGVPAASVPANGLGPGDHVFLVDGSSFVFRAYFQAINQDAKYNYRSDGLPTGALRLFCTKLYQFVREGAVDIHPTHLAIVFDKSEETFRKEIYPDYKGTRRDMPDDLKPQFPLMREAVKAFGLEPIEMAGYEADDIIATYAKQAQAAGAEVLIISSDKDLMQLVSDTVLFYDFESGTRGKPGYRPERRIDRQGVIDYFGVPPEKVIDVQALVGDTSDNVPGVPGIGPKAASTLIAELGRLDEALERGPSWVEGVLETAQQSIQQKLDELAGQPVKLNSKEAIGKILVGRFNKEVDEKSKAGEPSASTELLERYAAEGMEFCKLILRGRDISRTRGSAVKKLFDFADQARMSRQLVTLHDDVDPGTPLAATRMRELDAARLISFLKAIELATLTKRVAEASGVDPNSVEADPALRSAKHHDATFASRLLPAEAGETALATPDATALGTPPSPLRGRSPGEAGGEGGPGTVPTVNGHAHPAAAAMAGAKAATAVPIDRTKYETVTTLERLEQWIAEATALGRVAIDSEANSQDPMQADLCGVSLALAPGRACYIPLAHKAGESDLLGDNLATGQVPLRDGLALLKGLLESPSVLKIAQNLKFDVVLFARLGLTLAPTDDTMLMAYALDGGLGGYDVEALAGKHLGYTPLAFKEVAGAGRGQLGFDLVPLDRATQYAGEGPDIAIRLWMALKPRLAAEHMVNVYETLERPMIPVLARMQARGIKVDRQILSRLSGEFSQKLGSLESDIYRLAGEEFNIGSPKQLGDILFGKFGLAGGKKTKTGAWSTGADILDELAAAGNELASRILDWRQLSKLKSTYTDLLPGFIHPRTQRVHTSYALASTTTGRLSSSDPNLQNIPIRTEEGRRIRTAFIAEKGMKLVSADYSQIELRVVAHVAEIPQLKQAFADGLDIHAMTASEMFGVPVKGMPPEVRRRAKAINFGIIYGISAFGLANQLGIGRQEAGEYIAKYFERFPGIRDYMEAMRRKVRADGHVSTLFGRKIHFAAANARNPAERAFIDRAAINAPIQGTAADIIRRAMIRMEPALAAAKLSATMLLQVHDELVFEVPEAEVAATLPIVTRVMESAAEPAVQLSVPLQVDAKAGDNWDAAH